MSNGSIRLLFTRLRTEEKLLAEAAEKRGLPLAIENVRDAVFPQKQKSGDIFLCRCIGHHQNLAVARMLEGSGFRTVNSSRVMELCGDKVATSSVLHEAGIPQPGYRVAFSREGALRAAAELGYPVVFKPATGSWGRLLAKAQDMETAEAIAEHKEHLGPQHQIFYIQQWVEKDGFDIRAFIIGGEPVCAIRRYSGHWITNTARGGSVKVHPLDTELENLLLRVYDAIQGDFLAVDLFFTKGGYLVNEINDGAEFRNSITPTGEDIPGRVVELCASLLKRTPSKTGRNKPTCKIAEHRGPEVTNLN